MWLHLKGIEHTEVFIDLKAKPDWFLDISKTRCTPVMKIDDKIVEDSEAILDFLEHHTPAEPDLKSTQVALDVCPRILPIFKDYYFNQVRHRQRERVCVCVCVWEREGRCTFASTTHSHNTHTHSHNTHTHAHTTRTHTTHTHAQLVFATGRGQGGGAEKGI